LVGFDPPLLHDRGSSRGAAKRPPRRYGWAELQAPFESRHRLRRVRACCSDAGQSLDAPRRAHPISV
jgi:hypothetical protein